MVGGVAITASYQGRSGCYIGEDQIDFTVPSNAPTGCAVPLAVQIGTEVSNYTAIPIATGGRSCTMQSPAFSAAAVQALTTGAGPVTYASLSLGRTIASAGGSSGTTYEDIGVGDFAQISVSPVNQPTVLSSLDTPPLGTCTTSNSQVQAQPLFTIVTGIDAGAITVNAPPPDFPVTMKEQRGTGQATTYSADFSSFAPGGAYFSGGAYTIAAAGGADVGSFSFPFTITPTPSWPSGDQSRIYNHGSGLTRANGVTINWTQPASGSSPYWIEITGSAGTSATDTGNNVYASFSCWVPSAANTFAVPASVLLALPGGNGGEIDFKPTLPPLGFSATGLEVGLLSFQYETSFFMPLN